MTTVASPRSHLLLRNLRVVGYADSLPKGLVPRVVPPVFELIERPTFYVVPPFDILDDGLDGGAVVTRDELDRFIALNKVTRFDEPFDAKPGRTLWIDDQRMARYEPVGEAVETLRVYAIERAEAAWAAVEDTDYFRAIELADQALVADDGCLEALYARAVAYHMTGEPDMVALQRDAVEVVAPGTNFQLRFTRSMLGLRDRRKRAMALLQQLSDHLVVLNAIQGDDAGARLAAAFEAVNDLKTMVNTLTVTAVGAGKRILIVEDDADVRRIIQALLQRAGYDVLAAASGKEAFRILESQQVELAIIDRALPDADGEKLGTELSRSYGIRKLVISGYYHEGGGSGLPKPFKPADLLRRVESELTDASAQNHVPEQPNHIPERPKRRPVDS